MGISPNMTNREGVGYLQFAYRGDMVYVLKAGCFTAELLNNCIDISPAADADMLLSRAHSLQSPANYDICQTVMTPLSDWPHMVFLLLCTAHILSRQPRQNIYQKPVISWLWWSAFCLHPCILIKPSAAPVRNHVLFDMDVLPYLLGLSSSTRLLLNSKNIFCTHRRN